MTLNNSNLFLLLLTITTWASTFAQHHRIPDILPHFDDLGSVLCTLDDISLICPAIYDPVCVPSPKQCFTTPCYQSDTISNKCQACNTLGVISYTPGECQYKCEGINLPPPALDIRDNPVCALFRRHCSDSSCRETFQKATTACEDPRVVSFSLGACLDDIGEEPNGEDIGETGESGEECLREEQCLLEEECVLEEEHFPGGGEEECTLEEEVSLGEDQVTNEITLLCGSERPEICPALFMPVCITECADGECRRTASDPCSACRDSNVIAYTPGQCELERIQCLFLDLSATEMACTDEFDPVCGYSNDCTAMPCGTTAGNACEACNFQAKDYYTKGACEGVALVAPPS